MTKASEKDLGAMHGKLAKLITKMLDPQELKEYSKDEDGNIVETVRVVDPSPTWATLAKAFLKDNSISADPGGDENLKGLTEKLKDRGRLSQADVDEAAKSISRTLQ